MKIESAAPKVSTLPDFTIRLSDGELDDLIKEIGNAKGLRIYALYQLLLGHRRTL